MFTWSNMQKRTIGHNILIFYLFYNTMQYKAHNDMMAEEKRKKITTKTQKIKGMTCDSIPHSIPQEPKQKT